MEILKQQGKNCYQQCNTVWNLSQDFIANKFRRLHADNPGQVYRYKKNNNYYINDNWNKVI